MQVTYETRRVTPQSVGALCAVLLAAIMVFAFPGRAAAQARALNFDLVVYGSEPEGVAAAVTAARGGLRVLLATPDAEIGGVWTLSGLNQLDTTGVEIQEEKDKNSLMLEIYSKLRVNMDDSERGFDTDAMQRELNSLVAGERNITLRTNAEAVSALVKNEGGGIKFIGLILKINGVATAVDAPNTIDATGKADLVALAGKRGVNYTLGRESLTGTPETMSITPVAKIGNVDWNRIINHPEIIKYNVQNTRSASGFFEASYRFLLLSTVRAKYANLIAYQGLDLGRNDDGSVNVNSLRLFLGSSVGELALAKTVGKEFFKEFVAFANGSLTGSPINGFEHATFEKIYDRVYVRETRHIIPRRPEDTLTIDDIIEERIPEDTIAVGSYTVDIAPYKYSTNPYKEYDKVQHFNWNDMRKPRRYGMTARMCMPYGMSNLYVVGEAVAADPIAFSSVRVKPQGFVLAEQLVKSLLPQLRAEAGR